MSIIRPIVMILFFLVSVAKGQNYQFQFGAQQYGVTVENKITSDKEEMGRKKTELKEAFETAIKSYITALKNPEHPLLRTIGKISNTKRIESLENINIVIQMLDKDDPLKYVTTWNLPSFFGGGLSYVVKLPYFESKNSDGPVHFEHIALHELAHQVLRDFIVQSAALENEAEVEEEERRVEYIVYQMVGIMKYEIFMRELYHEEHPTRKSDAAFASFFEGELGWIGVTKPK